MTQTTGRSLDLEAIDKVLATMPQPFRNAEFRTAMGLPPFAASQLLTRLLKLGKLHHPRGNYKLWAIVAQADVSLP